MRTMLVVFTTVNVLIFTYIHIYVCMYVCFEYGFFSNPGVDYTHITTPAMLLIILIIAPGFPMDLTGNLSLSKAKQGKIACWSSDRCRTRSVSRRSF